jgi:putative transposase
VVVTHEVSTRRACRIVGISCSVYRYRPDIHRDDAVIGAIQEAVEDFPAHGFGKLFKILRRRGYRFNHKRVYRVYCLLKLNKRRRGKKRVPSRDPVTLAQHSGNNLRRDANHGTAIMCQGILQFAIVASYCRIENQLDD